MEIDCALAQSAIRGDITYPVLRFYEWNPACISIGYHQPLHTIDLAAAERNGIDVVRRPTGGRAVLHAEELTYAVISITMLPTVHAFYEQINVALQRGLEAVGIQTELQVKPPDLSKQYASADGAMCFSTVTKSEININGRKLVGSAQRRYDLANEQAVVLQHGSLLLGEKHKELPEYIAGLSNGQRQRMKVVLDSKTVSISEINPTVVSKEKIMNAVIEGFARIFKAEFTDILPDTVDHLIEKYQLEFAS